MTNSLRQVVKGALVVLLFLHTGGCVSVEADIQDIELTQKGLTVPGVPIAVNTAVQVFSEQRNAVDLPFGSDSEMRALDVTLIARSGIEDFAFVDALQLGMSDEQHGSVQLFDYVRAENSRPTGVLTIQSANPVDVFNQWQTDSAKFSLSFRGTLPQQDWSFDIRIRFNATLRYSASK